MSYINFKDFNFKLVVVQQLMYDKELITPKFDVYDFAASYKEREIDIEEEGYEIIPEVRDYFEKLEVDEKYITEITEIYQDGGYEIYLNIIPLWSGEDESFDIRSFEDLETFTHIKSMTLFYNEDNSILDKLKEKGIAAEWL